MARQEQDREDLIAEATALVERAEIVVPGFAEHVVVGFHRDGAASLYFGPDEVYHFNSACQLRRAYRDGLLYKSVRGKLAALRRHRTATQVELLRHDLDATETAQFAARLRDSVAALCAACRRGDVRVVAQVPPVADVTGRLLAQADQLLAAEIARAPHAR